MCKFWIIWNEKGSCPPKYKHASIESAKLEAERLAKLVPEGTFHVLELVGSCKRLEVVWKYPGNNSDDVPF